MDASRQRFTQQFSFSQIAGMAGWGSRQNVSRRFPLLVAHDSKHAEDLCGALNLRLARARPSARCGWLSANDFSDHERLDIETTISQVLEATLTEQFAEDLHIIASDALDVYEAILAKIAEHDFHTLQMDTSEKCYVFVRFFPELREPCPFVKWVVVPDDKLRAAMDATAQEWAVENAEKIWDRLLAQRQHLGIPQTPSDSQHDEGLEKMLMSLNQRGGAFAEVPKELAELLSEFMPHERTDEPPKTDEAPPERSGTETGAEPTEGTGRDPEDSQGKQAKPADETQTTVDERGQETLDEQDTIDSEDSAGDGNFLDITIGDLEASRVVKGKKVTAKFERNVKAWQLFRALYDAGQDGRSRDQIKKRVWPPNGAISENNLDQQKAKANNLIETISVEIKSDRSGVWRLAELQS